MKPFGARHMAERERLAKELKRKIQFSGKSIGAIARRVGTQPGDLASALRHERAFSLSKLSEVGETIGLELHMEWRAAQPKEK